MVSSESDDHLVIQCGHRPENEAASMKCIDPGLPIARKAEEIRTLLMSGLDSDVESLGLISSDTGTGKSTVLPKLVWEVLAKRGEGKVVVTVPREIAVLNALMRVKEEMNGAAKVGRRVGIDDIVFVTSSELIETLRDIVNDGRGIDITEALKEVCSVLLIDEAHERSLTTDLLIGLVRSTRQRELFCIVLSATIDKEIEDLVPRDLRLNIEGRPFDVPVTYNQPLNPNTSILLNHLGGSSAVRTKIMSDAVISLFTRTAQLATPPDILVFLPNKKEVLWVENYVKDELLKAQKEPIPRLICVDEENPCQLQKLFSPCKQRRIIFGTSDAETSITIPNVGIVIDCGVTECVSVDGMDGIEHRFIRNISQAEAIQRAGRAARTRAGRVFRIYSEDHFESMDRQREPDIKTSNVSKVILELLCLGVRDIRQFHFITRPDPERLANAALWLFVMGAIDSSANVTSDGRQMSCFKTLPLGLARTMQTACCLASAEKRLTGLKERVTSLLASFQVGNRGSIIKKRPYGDFYAELTGTSLLEETHQMNRIKSNGSSLLEEFLEDEERSVNDGLDMMDRATIWCFVRGLFTNRVLPAPRSGQLMLLNGRNVKINSNSIISPHQILRTTTTQAVFAKATEDRRAGAVVVDWLMLVPSSFFNRHEEVYKHAESLAFFRACNWRFKKEETINALKRNAPVVESIEEKVAAAKRRFIDRQRGSR